MTKKAVVCLFLFFLLPLNTALKAQNLSFLRYGGGARAFGMANAYTALAEGAEAAFWNPAFLESEGTGSSLLDYSKDENKQRLFLGFSYDLNKFTTGFSYYSNSVMNIKFFPKEQYFGISFSARIAGALRFGATVKYIYLRHIHFYKQYWSALDIGAGYSMLNNRLRFGAVIKDICFSKNDAAGNIKPFSSYRFGISYSFPKNEDNVYLTTSVELVHETDDIYYDLRSELEISPDLSTTLNIGNELNICEMFFIRLFGFSIPLNKDIGQDVYFIGGFGIRSKKIIFDLGGYLNNDRIPVKISLKYGF
ncbi:hypothetical protein ACFL4T_10805 [candidate division KSB1 bacterium]